MIGFAALSLSPAERDLLLSAEEVAKFQLLTGDAETDPIVLETVKQIQATQVQLAARLDGARAGHFQRVGHSLFALLAGLVGGTGGLWFYGRRSHETTIAS